MNPSVWNQAVSLAKVSMSEEPRGLRLLSLAIDCTKWTRANTHAFIACAHDSIINKWGVVLMKATFGTRSTYSRARVITLSIDSSVNLKELVYSAVRYIITAEKCAQSASSTLCGN